MGDSSSTDAGLRGSVDRQVCVLVVEDDPALQRMILNYFGENNIRTLLASNRLEMVDRLGNAEINLVILDLRLGLEDGLDLLREVRLSSDVPVIIITGHRRDDIDRVVGLELGADDYVTKPFNLRELPSSKPRSVRLAENTFCKQPAFTRMSSIAASTCRSSASGASSSAIPARPASYRPSAALDMCSLWPSNASDSASLQVTLEN